MENEKVCPQGDLLAALKAAGDALTLITNNHQIPGGAISEAQLDWAISARRKIEAVNFDSGSVSTHGPRPRCPEHKSVMKYVEKDGESYWKCTSCVIFISDEAIKFFTQFFAAAPAEDAQVPQLMIHHFGSDYRYKEVQRFTGEHIKNAGGVCSEPGWRWSGLAHHHPTLLAGVNVNGIDITPEGVKIAVTQLEDVQLDVFKLDGDLSAIGRRVLDAMEKHRLPDGAIDEIEAAMHDLNRVLALLRRVSGKGAQGANPNCSHLDTELTDRLRKSFKWCPWCGVNLKPASPAPVPATPECKGCKSQSLDYFEHDGCLIDKAVGREQARWQKAIYELCRKNAISPDDIDGSGCDSGDPLDLTLAEVGQVICQIENPNDYRATTQGTPEHMQEVSKGIWTSKKDREGAK